MLALSALGFESVQGLGAVPAAIDLIALIWLPESPRILLRQGKIAQAESVLAKIYSYATEEQIKAKLAVLEASVAQSREITEKTTLWWRFKSIFTVGLNRRALSKCISIFCTAHQRDIQ